MKNWKKTLTKKDFEGLTPLQIQCVLETSQYEDEARTTIEALRRINRGEASYPPDPEEDDDYETPPLSEDTGDEGLNEFFHNINEDSKKQRETIKNTVHTVVID